jgi:carbonic anhydrase
VQKLIQGILEFRRHVLPAYRMTFARLATSQHPDCLFIACADSRVVPNLFASTQPGDLFVVRNVGNLVPAPPAAPSAEASVAAAIEFSVEALGVKDIVVCGHSNCGAMKGLLQPPAHVPHVAAWLQNGATALERFRRDGGLEADLPEHDALSQVNVLTQVERVETYACVRERVRAGRLRVHGWWFEIGTADVHVFDATRGRFMVMDEAQAERLLAARNAG